MIMPHGQIVSAPMPNAEGKQRIKTADHTGPDGGNIPSIHNTTLGN